MDWLNYHHLLYFWVVAREGSIALATKELNLTQPTISAQLRQLEESLGEKLFAKSGRGLMLTEAGKIALRYADEIFALGRELKDVLKDRPTGKPVRVTVGIAEVVPKLVAYRVLRPAFQAAKEIEMICREASTDALLDLLAQHEVDLVLTDAPAASRVLRAFNHLLGESGTTFFAAPRLVATHRRDFPKSLNGAPLLMPGAATQLRRSLELWLDAHSLTPKRIGVFDDPALMASFGGGAVGIFAAPTAVEREIAKQYNVGIVGRVPALKERFYAVSAERKIQNPLVGAITTPARRGILWR